MLLQILIIFILLFLCFNLLYTLLGSVGSGKTSLEVYMAIKMYRKQFPNNTIYANFHLYDNCFPESTKPLENFVYTPYLIIPDSDIHDCCIIADDYSNIEAYIEPLIKNMANKSRKIGIDCYVSGQDFTYVNAKIRRMSRYIIIPSMNFPLNTAHQLRFFTENEKYQRIYHYSKWFYDIIQEIGKYYDTYEVVNQATERRVIEEIKLHSNNLDDLDINLEAITQNSQKKLRLFKQIGQELGFL